MQPLRSPLSSCCWNCWKVQACFAIHRSIWRWYADGDHGEWFPYAWSGGRNLSGNKRTNKVQAVDQEFEKSYEALCVSCKKGYPVRVVRSEEALLLCSRNWVAMRLYIQNWKLLGFSDVHGDRPSVATRATDRKDSQFCSHLISTCFFITLFFY